MPEDHYTPSDGTWGGVDFNAHKLLINHQRLDIGSCVCGWGVDTGDLGRSHSLHVWRELQREVLPSYDAKVRAAVAEEIADLRAALRTAGESADRFRDVLTEVLDLPENPGDDELVAQLRALHGKTGPEPTRWRDFVVDAAAILRPRHHPDSPTPTEEPADG